MVYTITFNPSLDYIVQLNSFHPGSVNRTSYENILPGGKGINVSIVLKNMGIDSTAFGFLAGFTGDEIANRLETTGISADFVRLNDGFSRINVKMKAEEETEVNGQGPKITDAAIEELYKKLDALQDGDILVISGSIPSTLPDDMYERIMQRFEGRDIRIVVDATRDLLMNVLKYKPFLIKPNNHELGEIYGVELKTRESVVPYAKKLQEQGAQNVLISMAGEGAVLVAADGSVVESPAPKGTVVNSVGAGDSMVAGFITGYLESNGDYEKAFRFGVCTGSASAFSAELATRAEVEELLAKL